MSNVTKGDGYAVSSLDGLGDGPGFRKIRKEMEVAELGMNAIVMPPKIESGFHFHERQEEVYFVHSGSIEIEFGDGTVHRLDAGGLARVDAPTHRKIRNVGDVGDVDAVYVIVGAEGGYVGRDGQAPEGDQRIRQIS